MEKKSEQELDAQDQEELVKQQERQKAIKQTVQRIIERLGSDPRQIRKDLNNDERESLPT